MMNLSRLIVSLLKGSAAAWIRPGTWFSYGLTGEEIVLKKLMGQILNPELPLKRRLFQLLSAIALVEFIIVSIYTVVSGGSARHIMIMLCGTALFAATVAYASKAERMRLGAAVSGLLYFSLYPITFFSSGGMYGGAPAVFAFALVYVFLVTEKWERAAALAVCIAASLICYAVSFLHPELLDRHTVAAEHVESFLSICLVTLLLCTLFAFVTEVYRTENLIVQRQKAEIEDLHLSQKRFFSSMSHEIRTPVNAVIGLNEMNLREDISEEVRENSRNIEVAGRILLQTINEIMDMSRLETGGMEVVTADYHTTAMLSDIVNMTWLRAQEKGLDLRIEADPALPRMLHGDEVHIRQILLNVITNAVKYTKEGSVTLSLGFRDEGSEEAGCELPGVKTLGTETPETAVYGSDAGQNNRIKTDRIVMTYDVKDTGIGIREESIPYLFDAFLRVDAKATHAIEGTGLGLSIVKQLLDMMGGTVSVDSVYGKGTTFHIEIPQRIVNADQIGTIDLKSRMEGAAADKESDDEAGDDRLKDACGNNGEPSGNPKICSLRILAVDDTPMNLMVVRKLLRDTGAVIETASGGKEALERTAQNYYDVILMDHQMPGMDGIECLHRIREQEGGKCHESRIVCLTANAGAEMQQIYMNEGFDGYLEKPVKGKTLENELSRQCRT